MATENIFIKGIRNILRKSRPILWRELYHTMHTIDTDRIFPLYYAIWLHIKLGFLATQRGRHTKKLVKEIRKNLFSALVNHADQNTIENYHLATLEEKQNLAYYVTWRLHSAMTYTHPNIYDNLQEIKFYNSEKYKLKNKKPAPYGEYYVSKRLIYYYSGVFEMDLTDLLNVIVHEYIHAMQQNSETKLPDKIIKFQKKHSQAYWKTPYICRPDEIEAYRLADLVVHNFDKSFKKYKQTNNEL